MNAADRRRVTPALGVLALLLLALLVALWAGVGRGAHWNDDALPPPLPPLRAATPPPSVPPLENFAQVWERPLFSPDRKPIAVVAGNADANTGDLELTGVILLPGEHIALLREKNTGRTLRVREGQSANGAAVVEVDPRSAVVDINGSRTELPLKAGPPPPNGGAGENGAPESSQPMVQMPQTQENAAPGSSAAAQSGAQGNDTDAAGALEMKSQAGVPGRSAAPAQTPAQSGQADSDAAAAWAQALKARIEQRRKRAAQKQAAQKQNDGG